MKTTLPLVLLAVGHASPQEVAPAPPEPVGSLQASVHRIVAEVFERQRLVGAQYAVRRDGELLFSESLGTAELSFEVPVSRDTRFLIASITKSMTASVLMRAAARGQVDLDALVQVLIPEFPVHPEGDVTLRRLVNQEAGIRHYAPGEQTAEFFDTHYETAGEALAVFIGDPFQAAPGTAERYSSYGFDLIAAALESATGQNFTSLLEREVFEPLGMADTAVPDMRFPIPRLASSYSFVDPRDFTFSEQPFRGRLNDYSYNPGGGNVISTAEDLALYGQAFFDGAYWGESAHALLLGDLPDTRPGNDEPYVVLDENRYGWLVGRDSAGRVFLHGTGASEAYQGGLTVMPGQRLVVVALSNTWGLQSRQGGFTLPMHLRIARAILDG